MEFNLVKVLYVIGFICTFLPEFVIYFIPVSGANIFVGFLFWVIIFALCLIYKKEKCLYYLSILIKTPVGKAYLFFMLYVIINTLYHIILGHYISPAYYYIARMKYFLIMPTLLFIYPALSYLLGFRLKTILKMTYIIGYCILLVGIIQYISFVTGLKFISAIIDFFSNLRLYTYFYHLESAQENLRAYAFFGEPSGLAKFIFIFMPLIFTFVKSSVKIFKNVFVNVFFKKSYLIIMFACLIFTKSPIYLVLCFTELGVLYLYHYRALVKKYLLFISAFILIFMFSIINIYVIYQDSLMDTYMLRIFNTIRALGSLDALIEMEPSLATRIISYIIQIKTFFTHPIVGVGFYNIDTFLNTRLFSYNIPLTKELITNFYNVKHVTSIVQSVVYTYLAEIGILGFSLYALFIYRCYSFLSKVASFFDNYDRVFINGLRQTIISISIISFYNLGRDEMQLWFILGFILLITVHYKNRIYALPRKREEQKQ